MPAASVEAMTTTAIHKGGAPPGPDPRLPAAGCNAAIVRISCVGAAPEGEHGRAVADLDRGLADILMGVRPYRFEGSTRHVHVGHYAGIEPAAHRVAAGHCPPEPNSD